MTQAVTAQAQENSASGGGMVAVLDVAKVFESNKTFISRMDAIKKEAELFKSQMEQEQAVYGAYIQSLQEAGVFVDTDWLQPSTTATVLTLKDGGRRVQDGPYADTKEQLGGYFVIEVPDLMLYR